jgi:hypothetical protein
MESLLLFRRALSSPTMCRLLPALSVLKTSQNLRGALSDHWPKQVTGISVAGEDITQALGGDMARPRCEQKETLEVNARKAVAHEKELESTLPEPEERKDALEGVELASQHLRDHLANCDLCRQTP